ncbi:MAG: DUF4065 domain-containing protein [Peptococcaceae bacterium]|nr:MAG: DUF4065 domain-containing protein [Peptococcaceae bacterium]
MRDKKEILANLILGFLNKAEEIPKTKLAKLILFAEIEHFRKTGDSITGLYFVRMRKGPVVAFFDEVLEGGEGKLWHKKKTMIPIIEEGRNKFQYSYMAKSKTDIPPEVQETIDRVFKEYGCKTGTALSNLSHSLSAWKYSEPDEPIYIAELACKNEEEYFALIDLVEDFDDDEILAEKLSQALSSIEV